MVSIGLFTNLKSGKNKLDLIRYGQNRRLKKLRTVIKDGNQGKVYITGEASDYLGDLEGKILQACQDKPEVLAIDGGDGTMSTVLTMFDKHWQGELPPIAIIPGGTFNILPKKMGIKNPFKYLSRISNTTDLDDLTVKGINMMRVIDGQHQEHLSFSVGVGLPVTMLEEAYKKKHMKYLRIALMMTRVVGSAMINGRYYQMLNKHRALAISTQGNAGKTTEDKEKWLGIIAQTIDFPGIPRFLPQPKIFRKAETDGRFHAIGTNVNLSKLLQYLPAIYSGDSPQYGSWESEQTYPVLSLNKQLKDLTIQADKPFKYQFNGELSFGYQPCLTKELYIMADKTFNFIEDDF